jgi:hypothetical protein
MASKHRNTDIRDPKTKRLLDRDPVGPKHEGVREEFALTPEEYEESGVPLMRLTPGDWFMIHLASWDLKRTVTFTGKLIYHGVGSCLIEVDRPGGADERVRRCAQGTIVVPLGTNDRDAGFSDPRIESHVDLRQFCVECGTQLDELDLCWTDGCGKQGQPQDERS